MIALLGLLAAATGDLVQTQFRCRFIRPTGTKIALAGKVTMPVEQGNPESGEGTDLSLSLDESGFFKAATAVLAEKYKDGSVSLRVESERATMMINLPKKGAGWGYISMEHGAIGHIQREDLANYIIPATDAVGFCLMLNQKLVKSK